MSLFKNNHLEEVGALCLHRVPYSPSLAIGFVLSLLGSVTLFIGSLGSFAGEDMQFYACAVLKTCTSSSIWHWDCHLAYWHWILARSE